MLFTSIEFLVIFLPIVFVLYYAFSFSRILQNILLLAVSIVFYAWGETFYVILLVACILANWLLALIISKTENTARKAWFVITCIINIGLLFFYKYLGFIFAQFNVITETSLLPEIKFILPLGISFYILSCLSYIIDVFRKDVKVEKNPIYVGLYIAFFPKLIAGPLVKYRQIADQLRKRKSSLLKITNGFRRFILGLAKKLIIANNLAVLADVVFNWSEFGSSVMDVPVVMAWLGIIAFSLQIYFDFSGYSDMAIGLGMMFGFEFPENFNKPYHAVSVSDFWKRWHISLTSWFREYVYFPLGGSRSENKDTMVRNLFIVWLLTGMWHGGEWTFIFWGLWHFIFQLAERFFKYDRPQKNLGLYRIYTLFVVSMGWVLFRAANLYQASIYIKNLFWMNGNSFFNSKTLFLIKEEWFFLLIALIACSSLSMRLEKWMLTRKNAGVKVLYSIGYTLALLVLLVISFSYALRNGNTPFIYFNF